MTIKSQAELAKGVLKSENPQMLDMHMVIAISGRCLDAKKPGDSISPAMHGELTYHLNTAHQQFQAGRPFGTWDNLKKFWEIFPCIFPA